MLPKKRIIFKFVTGLYNIKNQKRLHSSKKKSYFEAIEDFFDRSREKKIHDAFVKTLGNQEFIQHTINNKGMFNYSHEYVNDCIPKKFEEGWEYTHLTPLTFLIKKFGSRHTDSAWLTRDIDDCIKKTLAQKSDADRLEIQSNLVTSLIGAGCDVNKKQYLGKAVEFTYDQYGIHRVRPFLSFPLHNAIDSLNIGAVKTLIDNGARINESIEHTRIFCGDYSYSYDTYLLNKILQLKTQCIEDNNHDDLRLVEQIEQLMLKAGARKSNEQDNKPEWFDDLLKRHTQHNSENWFDQKNRTIDAEELCSLLGVPVESSPKEIRTAFLKKIKAIHPDNFQPGSTDYNHHLELTKKLIQLYDIYKSSIIKYDHITKK
jgi:hypothetical protein